MPDARGAWQLTSAFSSAPVQTETLDKWPDGSVRWLLVTSEVDLADAPAADATLTLLAAGHMEAESALKVFQQGGGVTVETGTGRFAMTVGGAFPLNQVEVASRDLLDTGPSGLTVTDTEGRPVAVRVTRVTVLRTGPLAVVVEVDGALASGPLTDLEFLSTLEFRAGSSTVAMSIRVRNPRAASHPGGFWDLGDPASLCFSDLSVQWQLAAPAGPPLVRCSAEAGQPLEPVGLPLELYQDSSGGDHWQSRIHLNRAREVPVRFKGYTLGAAGSSRSGLRATPIVQLATDTACLTVSVADFWQNFPKAIEATDHAVTVRLFPKQFGDAHELQAGEQKTHTLTVAFGPDTTSDLPLDWTRAPLVCRASTDWVNGSGAIPFIHADRPEHAAAIAVAVDGGDTFEHKRERVDEYGWRHFGDVYGDHEAIRKTGPQALVSHYNNQYDPVAGFLYQFLRSGDTRWWTMARELAAHVVDIDVYHTVKDKWAYNHGLFWHTFHYGEADTSTHRTYPKACSKETHGGGPSPDHNYTTGLMHCYFLTGNPVFRQTVIDLAQFVIDADDGNKTVFRFLSRANTGFATASGSYSYHGPGRGPANSLNALIDGHRLSGHPRFLAKAEALIRRVVHPNEDINRHDLMDAENKWFYLMFLQSLGKYVLYKIDRGELDEMYAYGRTTLLQYARWMAVNENPFLDRRDRLVFPTETWATHDIRKSDVFFMAAMHASGDERARFIERGRFFYDHSLSTLATMPTRTLARPVIVLLTSGLVRPWFEAHPDATTPEPAVRTFAAQDRFVPQKALAMKRAKMVVASATVAGVVLIALLVARQVL